MPRTSKPSHVADRGVYLAPFTANGDRTYFAIDSHGELLDSMRVPIGGDPMEAIDALWIQLERKDPTPLKHGTAPSSFELRLA